MRFLALGISWSFLLGISWAAWAATEDNKGTLTLYRWNPGYRAESEASLTLRVSEKEYKNFIQTSTLPLPADSIYSGCYLSHFERKLEGRQLASTPPTPRKEVFRVCVPRK